MNHLWEKRNIWPDESVDVGVLTFTEWALWRRLCQVHLKWKFWCSDYQTAMLFPNYNRNHHLLDHDNNTNEASVMNWFYCKISPVNATQGVYTSSCFLLKSMDWDNQNCSIIISCSNYQTAMLIFPLDMSHIVARTIITRENAPCNPLLLPETSMLISN